jgi:hypothetical protein
MSLLSHRRLLVNLLLLIIAISALAFTRPANAQNYVCDTGCVSWDAQNGCTQYMTCCVASPSDWICIEWSPNQY